MPDPAPATAPAQPAAPSTPAPAATPAAAKPAETPQTPAGTSAAPTPPAGQPAAPATPAEPAKPPEQTPEQKAAADKEQQARTRGPDGKFLAEPLIPADWKPKAPDGVKLDEALVGSFKSIMADPKLSHADRAQAIVDMHIKANAEADRQYAETLQRLRAADIDKARAHQKYGGAFFQENITKVKALLSSVPDGAGERFSKKLESVGLDCDPDGFVTFSWIRSFLAEDTTSSRLFNTPPAANGTKPISQTERQARTYANTKPNH